MNGPYDPPPVVAAKLALEKTVVLLDCNGRHLIGEISATLVNRQYDGVYRITFEFVGVERRRKNIQTEIV
jgi:hypothetical protein